MRNAVLIARAKSMRTAPSEPEQRMWLALRAARFAGVKFRRQKVIGPFIVDFASRVPMLVVEIDGDTHAERTIEDDDRSRFLEQQGYRVIRYTNHEVMTNLEGVLTHLAGVVATAPLPTLSPEGERAL
ncbi:endonuclease domain-containing protein [Sphingomonas qomolangmaensis]|uniref:Endonuclease domain-containing protein n=1 Tax=Sphingomonas qomolangmaensis TaxID=2918765 RepID=A0ABY5LG71_9SPHN|nr:endonuclease domain-containing protein [Sphingomonas qomolangmaensis]UUL83701.1 endonuclease domain-containing protein [Sphingomonas qomolangmaensis]